MATRSSDDLDIDHTDELPVLRETVGLDDGAEPSPIDGTDGHTALYAPEELDGSSELFAELAARAEQIPALEAQIRVLTDGMQDLEREGAAKDRLIAELRDTLAALRGSADDSAAAERRAAAQLAVRDGRVAELTAAVERLQEEAAARSSELERLRTQAEAAQRATEAERREIAAAQRETEAARSETEALRAELTAKTAPAPPSLELERLREENAALAAYIAGRRTWWDELGATHAALTARVAALTNDLAAREQRLAAADALATRESQRAVALRAELVDYARRVESLEREVKLARDGQSARLPPAAATPAEPTEIVEPRQAAETARPPPAEPTSDAAAVDLSPPVLTDAVGAVAPAVEAVAQLEAEVEYKRQQVAAQLVELRDRAELLRAATSDLERTRRELGALRADVDESRASVARLERAVVDKDRALEARDARIATLHEELRRLLAAGEKHAAASLAALEPAGLPGDAPDKAADGGAGPALVCLTGDAPRRFALTKRTVTVGRGPQCDLQILTHFVSREHARLTSNGGITLIEDLGSRNGVFVNSVRVERRPLQQGDLVTIGETQFRFVESMAH